MVERPHGDKGSYRVGSASNLTATYRKHDDDKEVILGYNPTVLTTSVFIRETQVDTGAQPDNVALPEVLQSQFDHHSFFPDHLAGDMKYGYGKTRALLFNQSDLFKRGIKIRMPIERIIYCLTNLYGARKAHSYGQPRADFQLKMQATAFNFRQLVREVLKKPHPTPAGGGPLTA